MIRKFKNIYLFLLNNIGFLILIPIVFFITPFTCNNHNQENIQKARNIRIKENKLILKAFIATKLKDDKCIPENAYYKNVFLNLDKNKETYIVTCKTFDLLEEISIVYIFDSQLNKIFGPETQGSFSPINYRDLDEDSQLEIINNNRIWKLNNKRNIFEESQELSDWKFNFYKRLSAGTFEIFFIVIAILITIYGFIIHNTVQDTLASLIICFIYLIIFSIIIIPCSFIFGKIGFFYYLTYPFFYKYIHKFTLFLLLKLNIKTLEKLKIFYVKNVV